MQTVIRWFRNFWHRLFPDGSGISQRDTDGSAMPAPERSDPARQEDLPSVDSSSYLYIADNRLGRYKRKVVSVKRFQGDSDPPSLQWKACHPSTRRRFKATMGCDQGHILVLKEHSISPEGRVWPSVVCNTARCRFHEFVVLEEWDGGGLD